MLAKRCVCVILALVLTGICLTGCRAAEKQITCQDVMAAYVAAGYYVFHEEATAEKDEWDCYVLADAGNGDKYILFYFFEDAQAAEAYADKRQWNGILWLYSVACGEPFWLTTKTYGCIAYEYADRELVQPFRDLIN